MTTPQKIALVGYGQMGQALHKGWKAAGINASFTIVDPVATTSSSPDIYENAEDASAALGTCSIILLAVKPQIMQSVCAELKPHIAQNALIISIAAGQTLSNFTAYFGNTQPVIRIMPNTPAAIGKGVSVLVANTHCSAAQKDDAEKLLKPAGQTYWIEDEQLMNAVTAISGSGPAYLFYFIEAFTQSARKAGLPEDLAHGLARQTVIGSAYLAEADSTTSAAQLRKNVTSPGGTTEAALSKLMDGTLQNILDEAVRKAIKRGEEL